MPTKFESGSRALRVLFLVSLIGVTVLSLLPQSGREMMFSQQDKVLHASAYIYFYFLGWLCFAHSRQSSLRVWLLCGLAAYGVIIEFLQGMTGYRDSDFADVLANITGLCLGLGVVTLYRRRK